MIKERCWVSQINFFIEYFPHRINVLFLSSQFDVIHIQIRITLFHAVRKRHSQLETFSQLYFNRIFSTCLSHNSPVSRSVFVVPYRALRVVRLRRQRRLPHCLSPLPVLLHLRKGVLSRLSKENLVKECQADETWSSLLVCCPFGTTSSTASVRTLWRTASTIC